MFKRKNNTIGAQIIISIFDKVILGVLLFSVATFVQYKISGKQEQSKIYVTLVESNNNLVDDIRYELLENINNYLFYLKDLKVEENEESILTELSILKKKINSTSLKISSRFQEDKFSIAQVELERVINIANQVASSSDKNSDKLDNAILEIKKQTKNFTSRMDDAIHIKAKLDLVRYLQ